MNDYELAVILHPDLEIDLDKILAKIDKLITDADGKIEERDDWGKRKLAYPIAKQTYGIYLFYKLQLPPQKIAGLEKNILITDEIIRHLLVRKHELSARALARIEARNAKKPATKKKVTKE